MQFKTQLKALSGRLANLAFRSTASRLYLATMAALMACREVSVRFTDQSHSASLDMTLNLLTTPTGLVLRPLEYLVTLNMTGTTVLVSSYVTLLTATLVQAALIGMLAERVANRGRGAAA
ncbi:SCO4225 family membrane protein [Streptomyces sp. NPDC002644]